MIFVFLSVVALWLFEWLAAGLPEAVLVTYRMCHNSTKRPGR